MRSIRPLPLASPVVATPLLRFNSSSAPPPRGPADKTTAGGGQETLHGEWTYRTPTQDARGCQYAFADADP